MKNLPRLLINSGLILLVFGVFKKTTVETGWGQVHNIGLMQQQNNLLLLGAIALIAGLILKSGTHKSDVQNQEDELAEKAAEERAEKKVEEVFAKVDLNLKKLKSLVAVIPFRLNAYRERFFVRVGIALGSSLLLMGASVLYVVAFPLTSLLFLVLTIWPKTFEVAIKRVMLVASVIASLGVLLNLAIYGTDLEIYLITGLIVNGLLIFGYLKFRKI